MSRILLAFDKFKGSLSSNDVALAFAEGWLSVATDTHIDTIAVADGGDGLLQALSTPLGATPHTIVAHDPLYRSITTRYAIVEESATAIIEMAQISGLALLAPTERNPMLTSSYGLGEVIIDALNKGCRRIILGIGGSATNDGGMGMLSALGYRFFDTSGRELVASAEAMSAVAAIDSSGADSRLSTTDIIVASDVDNPLCGERGASLIYAPQKGANENMALQLDKSLMHYADVVERHVGASYRDMAGAGAAGGLGFALVALLGAHLKPGVDIVLDALSFDTMLNGCDLVVTGEGRIDKQTLMGKAPAGVLQRAMRRGVSVIALGGYVEWCDELRSSGFKAIYSSMPEGMDITDAMQPITARQNIYRAAAAIARQWLSLRSL